MLMLPRPNMGVSQNNLAATPAVGAVGVNITASASTNTKGAWATMHASTNFDVSMIQILFVNNSLSATVRNWLIDIGVGAAASEQVLVSNLMGTHGNDVTSGPMGVSYQLPIFVPKGTRISARGQCTTGSQTTSVVMFLYGGPSTPPWALFSGAEAIGVNTGTSAGTAITAGSTGTESSWTAVGSTTAREYHGIFPMIGTDTATVMNSRAYHMEWGYSSTTLDERYFIGNNTEFVGNMFPNLINLTKIPVGTQLQVRVECSAVGDSLQYGLLGFY